MRSDKKLAIIKNAFIYIATSIILSVAVFVLSGSLSVSLIIGFAYFLYSLSAIYMYYQEISRETKEERGDGSTK